MGAWRRRTSRNGMSNSGIDYKFVIRIDRPIRFELVIAALVRIAPGDQTELGSVQTIIPSSCVRAACSVHSGPYRPSIIHERQRRQPLRPQPSPRRPSTGELIGRSCRLCLTCSRALWTDFPMQASVRCTKEQEKCESPSSVLFSANSSSSLLIQRWKEPKSGESHAFLLFETEQAAMACCSRIGALRVTSDRSNSRPITASALSCTNAASSAILNQWLRSQHMVPSYVIKNPPPPPPSASFPLACLTPLTENCGLVVQMLREHKCALSWWRFVAQMYVANKMWTPAQFILGHSTKSEEDTEGQSTKGKEKENQTIDCNTTEDIIDISVSPRSLSSLPMLIAPRTTPSAKI